MFPIVRILCFALAAVLPVSANAQSDAEYSDGLVIPPIPIAPSILPNGAIVGPGSIAPSVILVPVPAPPSAMTVQPGDVTGSIRRGCETQSYVVGPGQRVRVHRCY